MITYSQFLTELYPASKQNLGRIRTRAYWKFSTTFQGFRKRKLMCPRGFKSSGPLYSHCVPQSPKEKTTARFIAFHSNIAKFRRHLGSKSGISYSLSTGLKRQLRLQQKHRLGLGSKLATHYYGPNIDHTSTNIQHPHISPGSTP